MSAVSQSGVEHAVFELRRYVRRQNHGAQGNVRAGQSLGESHEIRPARFAMRLPREPFAAPSEAANDFIRDQVYAAAARLLAQTGPEIIGSDDAVGAGVRL